MGVMLATNLDVLMFALELLKACRILSDPILTGAIGKRCRRLRSGGLIQCRPLEGESKARRVQCVDGAVVRAQGDLPPFRPFLKSGSLTWLLLL